MMAKLKGIVAALVFLGALALGTGLIAQQGTGGGAGQAPLNPAIKVLIEARVAAAKEVFEMGMAPTPPTRTEPLDDLPTWSRRWMDEQINLDPSPSKQFAAIQDHLNRIKQREGIAEQRHQTARGNLSDTIKMKYFRLEAEQMLAEIRIINPNASAPKPAPKS